MMAQQWTQQGSALSAQGASTRGTGRSNGNSNKNPHFNCNHPDWLTVPCVACPAKNKSREFHCMRECFDGGLSHLTDDEKEAWLQMKRMAKEQRYQRNAPGNDRQRNKRRRGYDNNAEHADLVEEVHSLKRQLRQKTQTDAHLTEISNKAAEHGLEDEFNPLVQKTRGVIYLSH